VAALAAGRRLRPALAVARSGNAGVRQAMGEAAAAGGLYAAIEATLAARAQHAVIEAGSQSLTGAQLDARVARAAGALAMLGVGRGDRVVVQAEKSLSQAILYLAVLRAGGVYVPLNTAYQRDEIAYFTGDAEPALLVCDPARAQSFGPLVLGTRTRLVTLGADGRGTLADAVLGAAPTPAVAVRADELASIIYTSGTTGRSKGAMLTHANLLENARALVTTWQIGASDVLLHALPLFHIHGLFVALNTLLLAGGRVQLLRSFDPPAVIEALPRATLFMGVPTYYTRLLATQRLDRRNTASIRAFISGSAPLLPQTFQAFEAATGHRVLERYGMSECGIISSNPLDGPRVPGAVGLPLPGVELRIADVHGAALAAGEAGVVEVRGAHVFKGYWRMPERTAAELRADGYFVTGDIGRIDAHGYLHIVGRAKDLVITGGLNVYPKEIEQLLDSLPGVGESAVIGLPHPDFGEAVAAVVCPASGLAAPEPEALIAAARQKLAGFKVPKVIFLVDELPRNTMGKVQKAVLRERYAATFGGA
jgi:malonyl-CoA/methylmalonyl-CoA synthetase